jgi:hypothetical protein
MSIGSEHAVRTSPIPGKWLTGLMVEKRRSRRPEREPHSAEPRFLEWENRRTAAKSRERPTGRVTPSPDRRWRFLATDIGAYVL